MGYYHKIGWYFKCLIPLVEIDAFIGYKCKNGHRDAKTSRYAKSKFCSECGSILEEETEKRKERSIETDFIDENRLSRENVHDGLQEMQEKLKNYHFYVTNLGIASDFVPQNSVGVYDVPDAAAMRETFMTHHIDDVQMLKDHYESVDLCYGCLTVYD